MMKKIQLHKFVLCTPIPKIGTIINMCEPTLVLRTLHAPTYNPFLWGSSPPPTNDASGSQSTLVNEMTRLLLVSVQYLNNCYIAGFIESFMCMVLSLSNSVCCFSPYLCCFFNILVLLLHGFTTRCW